MFTGRLSTACESAFGVRPGGIRALVALGWSLKFSNAGKEKEKIVSGWAPLMTHLLSGMEKAPQYHGVAYRGLSEMTSGTLQPCLPTGPSRFANRTARRVVTVPGYRQQNCQ
jgi:hypothetical protein